MKLLRLFILPCLGIFCLSCNNSNVQLKSNSLKEESNKNPADSIVSIKVRPDEITKDFLTWYTYTYRTVRLAQDYIGLSLDSVAIGKTAFLHQLTRGNVIPLKIGVQNNVPVFKLFPLTANDTSIRSTIKQMASIELNHRKLEGTEFPSFQFTDINGKEYSKSNTKGRVLLIKCWFIHCVACIKEFPELNRLVDEYKDEESLDFISLATDTKKELEEFLQKRPFRYAVVPRMGDFMADQLKVTAYPTHILIGRDGKIVKVTNTVEDIKPFLRKLVD